MSVKKELLKLKNRHGLITPLHVVTAAADPESPLHSYFTWDDSKAAHEYRLWEARKLIASVRVVDEGGGKSTFAFVSLMMDRRTGGYRDVDQVVSDAELTAELERTALAELETWSRRHAVLMDLVKNVMSAAKNHLARKTKKKRVS